MQPQEHLDATLIAADRNPVDPDTLRRLRPAGWLYVIRRVARDFFPEGLRDLGALLAFFSVLSLAPALLVTYSLITLFLSNESLEILVRVSDLVRSYVPAEHEAMVMDAIHQVSGSAAQGQIGLVVGVLVALWTSSTYVRAFSRCANAVWGRTEGRNPVRLRTVLVLLNLGLILGAVVVLVSLVITAPIVQSILGPVAEPLRLTGVLEFLTETFIPVWNWLKWPVILVAMATMIATLYHWAPNVRPPKFRLLSAGAVFALAGILIAAWLFNIYIVHFASLNTYGAVGAVLGFFAALWILNILLVLGMKIDAEISRAQQLQAGYPAEEHNLLPPRSITMVTRMNRNRERSLEAGRQLRQRPHPPTES